MIALIIFLLILKQTDFWKVQKQKVKFLPDCIIPFKPKPIEKICVNIFPNIYNIEFCDIVNRWGEVLLDVIQSLNVHFFMQRSSFCIYIHIWNTILIRVSRVCIIETLAVINDWNNTLFYDPVICIREVYTQRDRSWFCFTQTKAGL